MTNPPIPRRKPPAIIRPARLRASAWPDLDPHARMLLWNEFMAANPGFTASGGVDFDSPFEPLVTDQLGRLISLAGEVVDDDTRGMEVPITNGIVIKRDRRLWLVVAVLVAALAMKL